jgi:hypothetical protein
MARRIVEATFALLLIAGTSGTLHAQEAVRAANENLAPDSETDDLGITIPYSLSHPGRLYPASDEFPTGPEIGERLPTFSLPNQHGRTVDFHTDRGNSKSIVVFYRSAVW